MLKTSQMWVAGAVLAAGIGWAAVPALMRATAPAPTTAQAEPAAPARRTPAAVPSAQAHPAPLRRAAAVCADCARVLQVNAVEVGGEGTGLGGIAGGVVGAAIGNQIGGGNGRKVAQVAGAVGGALAGHEIEKKLRTRTEYEVVIERSNGSRQTLRYAEPPAVRIGEQVRVVDGTLVAAR
jgi:outer membrane lipoprotein SlyB